MASSIQELVVTGNALLAAGNYRSARLSFMQAKALLSVKADRSIAGNSVSYSRADIDILIVDCRKLEGGSGGLGRTRLRNKGLRG